MLRVVALVVAFAIAGCRCNSTPEPKPTNSGEGPEKVAGSGALTARNQPPLLPTDATPEPTTAQRFSAQVRDDEWASATEQELTRRATKVGGAKLQGTECRHDQCRMDYLGTAGEIEHTIDGFAGHRGLHGYAKNVLLSTPVQQSDGTIAIAIYALFERDN